MNRTQDLSVNHMPHALTCMPPLPPALPPRLLSARLGGLYTLVALMPTLYHH